MVYGVEQTLSTFVAGSELFFFFCMILRMILSSAGKSLWFSFFHKKIVLQYMRIEMGRENCFYSGIGQ